MNKSNNAATRRETNGKINWILLFILSLQHGFCCVDLTASNGFSFKVQIASWWFDVTEIRIQILSVHLKSSPWIFCTVVSTRCATLSKRFWLSWLQRRLRACVVLISERQRFDLRPTRYYFKSPSGTLKGFYRSRLLRLRPMIGT